MKISFIATAMFLALLISCEYRRHQATVRSTDAKVQAVPIVGRLAGPVTKIRNGDTIEVSGVPIRLNGLHCPERDEAGGMPATHAVQRLLGSGEAVCELTGETTYDRQVGWCASDGVDLGESLIRDGYCARCPRYDPKERYLAAQAAAGAWPGSMPPYCS